MVDFELLLNKEKEDSISIRDSVLLGSGKIGIRTLGTLTGTPHFECGPIDHSGIFPCTRL